MIFFRIIVCLDYKINYIMVNISELSKETGIDYFRLRRIVNLKSKLRRDELEDIKCSINKYNESLFDRLESQIK